MNNNKWQLMSEIKGFMIVFLAVLVLGACGSKKDDEETEDPVPTRGNISIPLITISGAAKSATALETRAAEETDMDDIEVMTEGTHPMADMINEMDKLISLMHKAVDELVNDSLKLTNDKTNHSGTHDGITYSASLGVESTVKLSKSSTSFSAKWTGNSTAGKMMIKFITPDSQGVVFASKDSEGNMTVKNVSSMSSDNEIKYLFNKSVEGKHVMFIMDGSADIIPKYTAYYDLSNDVRGGIGVLSTCSKEPGATASVCNAFKWPDNTAVLDINNVSSKYGAIFQKYISDASAGNTVVSPDFSSVTQLDFTANKEIDDLWNEF